MTKRLFFFLLISIASCHSKQLAHQSPNDPNISAADKVNPTIVDTLKKDIYDTANTSKEFTFYETREDTVLLLSKYFEKDLCNPGNLTHPTYLAFQKKANELIPVLKEKIKIILNNSEQRNIIENCPSINAFKKKLGDVERLYNCDISPIPYYHLAFNIVNRKNSDMDFINYFNLDTISIYYKIQLHNELIGIIYSNSGTLKIACFYPQDSLSYNKITALRKEAILIKRDLVNVGSSYQNFGFLLNHRLFFGQCYLGELTQRDENSQKAKILYTQECEFIPSQAFYLKPSTSSINLARIIKDGFISKSH